MAINFPSYNFNSNQYQNQQVFPQPQGSSYIINNSVEISNIPMGMGISVALCLSEGLMFLKTMQNGNPILMAYKITPYTQENNSTTQGSQTIQQSSSLDLTKLEQKVNDLEQQISELKKIKTGGRLNEQLT